MTKLINSNVLEPHYDLPKKISIDNQEYIWLSFNDYAKGVSTPKKEKTINEFFLKLGVFTLMKTYPSLPSSYDSDVVDSSTNNLWQKDKLHDVFTGLIEYYMPRITSHILVRFPICPSTFTEKRIFVSYFLTKASHLLSSTIRKDSTLESREISGEIEWIAANASPIARKAQELEEKEKELREKKREKLQEERTPEEILKGIEKELPKQKPIPKIDIHPQMPTPEEKVIKDEEYDEWIESLTPRQKTGKKNRQRIEDIYREREWWDKQLVTYYIAGGGPGFQIRYTLGELVEKNIEKVLNGLILPVEDKLLFIPDFKDVFILNDMWKIYLSGKLPEVRVRTYKK